MDQHCQALHPKTQKMIGTPYVAWRPGLCRQVVSLPEPQNQLTQMSRLAVVHHPPGDFWKFSRNAKIHEHISR